MAKNILRPAGVGVLDNWTLFSGGSKVGVMDPGDPPVANSGGGELRADEGDAQQFTWTNRISPILAITGVDWRLHAGTSGSTINVEGTAVATGGSGAAGTPSFFLKGPTFATFGNALNCFTGAPWTDADYYSNFAVTHSFGYDSGSDQFSAFSAWLEVAFDMPPGGGGFLVASLLASMIGAGVGAHEMPAIGQVLARDHGVIFTPAELKIAWRELRAPRPRFFL